MACGLSKTPSWSTHVYATGFNGKICSKCDELLDVSNFYASPRQMDNLKPTCKKCDHANVRIFYSGKSGSVKSKLSSTYRRSYFLKKAYNMSIKDYEDMFRSQDGKCLIFTVSMGGILRCNEYPHIDHNHKTGKVRGILCSACNRAIGLLKEDIPSFRRAIEHLEK